MMAIFWVVWNYGLKKKKKNWRIFDNVRGEKKRRSKHSTFCRIACSNLVTFVCKVARSFLRITTSFSKLTEALRL